MIKEIIFITNKKNNSYNKYKKFIIIVMEKYYQ